MGVGSRSTRYSSSPGSIVNAEHSTAKLESR